MMRMDEFLKGPFWETLTSKPGVAIAFLIIGVLIGAALSG